jgi:hypothetical protein
MLPKLSQPIHTFTVPSSGKPIKMRPMKVADEKLLLMAKEGGNANDILATVKQIINNCILDEKFDVNKLSLFDVDWLFIKLRVISVGKDITVVYFDHGDQKEYPIEIDLDTIEIKGLGEVDSKIPITDTTGLIMKYPTCDIYDTDVFKKEGVTSQELFDELVLKCLDKYYDGEVFTNFKDQHPAEVKTFINDLDVKTYHQIKRFIEELPTLFHESKYTNSLGEEKVITSTSLPDFFTFA